LQPALIKVDRRRSSGRLSSRRKYYSRG
jgi:hypothetical protein